MILTRRPHRLTVYEHPSGYTDDNGDFTPGARQEKAVICCLAEPNGKAETIEFEGGSKKVYAFQIITDPRCPDLRVGEEVKLNRMGHVYELRVLGFQRYQHSCQIWV